MTAPFGRVCLTGGAGFIGSHLAEALVSVGAEVTVLDDLSTGHRENLPAGVDFVECDIRGRRAAEVVAAGGFDLLVHQAAQMDVRKSVADPRFDADVNILGSLNLLEAARAGGVRRVLFASTGGAIYGEQDSFPATEEHPTRPVSPYGVAKLAVERYLYFYAAAYGLEAISLRYANVYGERQRPDGEAGVVAIFLSRLLAGQPATIHGDGRQTRDYVHVSDVVRANLAAAGAPRPEGSVPFAAYNVGTGRETDVVELYGHLAAAVGSRSTATHGPGKPGEQRRSVIDGGRLRRQFGLPEPRSLAEGLAATAGWFAGRVPRS